MMIRFLIKYMYYMELHGNTSMYRFLSMLASPSATMHRLIMSFLAVLIAC
jgi:hypothetical protein